jgi:hypothetical protein
VNPVYLWQADGAASGARGVSHDRQAARRAAEGRLLSGEAATATVEEAVAELGARTLGDDYYWRTGKRWRARVGAGGRVRWAPARTEAPA